MASQWLCEVCGYIHQGDAPPSECPVCGVGPEMFTLHEETEGPERGMRAASRWRCTVCDYAHDGDAPPDECPVCGVDASLFEPADEPAPASAPAVVAATEDAVVIVGGGVAAVTAAEHARRQSPGAAITLIHREPHLPYNRLNLTRLVAGEIDESELELHGRSWYAERRIRLVAGEVSRCDADARCVELADGRSIPFARLVLANGAHPFVPPIAGASRDGVLPLRTRDHVQALLERARAGSRCVCIGGGLLGLEVAGGLARRGVRVTALEGFGSLLPRQLAPAAGRLLQEHLEGLGIAVRCAARIKEIVGDEAVRAVRLDDGEEMPADVVLVSTGIRPNSYLARQCGLEVRGGVIVDDHLRTSDAHIFAAGDVAEHRGVVYGLWPAALAQGRVAGINAAGGEASFVGMPPAVQIKVLDVDLYSVGEFMPRDGASRVVERHGDGSYLRLVCRDGGVIGANLYGDLSLSASIKEAIERRTQIADLGRLLELLPELRESA